MTHTRVTYARSRILDNLNIEQLIERFVSVTTERRAVFGVV